MAVNPNSPESAAHHEAAHVVVAHHFGFAVERVAIYCDEPSGNWGGRADLDLPPKWKEDGWIDLIWVEGEQHLLSAFH